MLTTQLLYALAGCVIVALGLRGALLHASLLQRIVAINIMGAGVFMLLVAVAYRGPDLPPDPLPHALVLTGIVVAVSATALALALARRLHAEQDDG
jgi:multicomponent Na+:H+ antiporter subunit C